MRNGSVTRSFRLDKDLDLELERVAEKEGTSVNSLALKSLRKLVEWDIYAEKFGLITLSATVFQKMLSAMKEEDVRQIGKWTGSNLAKDFMAIWFKKVDLDSAIKALELLGSKYGKAFKYEYETDGRMHTVIMNHGIGPKGTLFYRELLVALFQDMLHRELTVDTTDESVIGRVISERNQVTVAPRF